jgi:hypothetical protein
MAGILSFFLENAENQVKHTERHSMYPFVQLILTVISPEKKFDLVLFQFWFTQNAAIYKGSAGRNF